MEFREYDSVPNACWDLDHIEESSQWKIIILNSNDNVIISAKELLKDYESGTVVIINKLDKLIDENNMSKSEDKFFRIIEKVKKHISLVFHRFIEEDNLEICLNCKMKFHSGLYNYFYLLQNSILIPY